MTVLCEVRAEAEETGDNLKTTYFSVWGTRRCERNRWKSKKQSTVLCELRAEAEETGDNLKTTECSHQKTRCRKPYTATQHLMLLMMGVCTPNMSS